jgi:predicted ArsR family transcriptional regulator
VLEAVVEVSSSGGAATVGELVEVLGGHPNTVRHHLAGLAAEGLVRAAPAPASPGRGRPPTRYRATERADGALPTGSDMVEEYVALAAAFAERLAARGGDPGGDARSIGRAWGATLLGRGHRRQPGQGERQARGRRRTAAASALARPAAGAVDQVLAVLGRLGFSPQVQAAPPESGEPGPEADGPTTVLLRTCPLLESARRHPEVVCQVHRGLVEGVLEAGRPAGGGPVHPGVRLEAFARPGACVLTLTAAATLAR